MKIDLLGTSFTLQSDEDPEYLGDLVAYVRAKVSEIVSTVKTHDNLKIAILSAIVVTDELFKERSNRSERNSDDSERADEVNRIARELISRIDETIADGAGAGD